ncbi:hypothetical protein D3C71_2229820 [compost metagenome]
MRVRAHVDALAWAEDGRSHMVDEHEWTDAARLQAGHGTANLEAAEVMDARADDGGHGWLLRLA